MQEEHLDYTLHPSAFGLILIAQSKAGICAILMDNKLTTLVADLQQRFPHAHIHQNDRSLKRVATQIVAAIENPAVSLDVALDIRGTDFQKRVWKALRNIPAGKTASYTHIAEKLNSPRAVRAVAGACAANTLAVVIPCHRVIRSDGTLSGYRWGIERKQKLLELEAHHAAGIQCR